MYNTKAPLRPRHARRGRSGAAIHGTRARDATLLLLAGFASGVAARSLARRYGIGRASALDAIRAFNKARLNPLVLRFAGRGGGPYAVLGHLGRHSGRMYHTRVVAIATDDGFVIPLPYGIETDWCRNVRATGECTVERRGETHAAMEPEILDAEAALPTCPPGWRLAFRLFGITRFLRVRRMLDRPVEQVPVWAEAVL